MNFLKSSAKKIKTVVHGNKRKDDDDEFENYIPQVPPHPGSLALGTSNFANFDSATFSSETPTASTLPIPPLSPGIKSPESPVIPNFEELKAKEEEYKREEKERFREQIESKKDKEEWKFFLSLTAKVDAVTSKTQEVLEKFQTESAVKDIAVVEDITFEDKYDETAPKSPGLWVAFEETQDKNPSDPVFIFPEEKETEKEEVKTPVIDEATVKIAKELIDDFGFTNPTLGIPLVPEIVDLIQPETPTVDPFDTSFIDVDALKSGKPITGTAFIKDIDVEEIDPFDTSHIESTIKQDLVIKD